MYSNNFHIICCAFYFMHFSIIFTIFDVIKIDSVSYEVSVPKLTTVSVKGVFLNKKCHRVAILVSFLSLTINVFAYTAV